MFIQFTFLLIALEILVGFKREKTEVDAKLLNSAFVRASGLLKVALSQKMLKDL